MDLINIFTLFIEYINVFISGIVLFVGAFQWGFDQLTTIFNSFLSLYSFVTSGYEFLSSFFTVFPDWLYPFVVAVMVYWLVFFIIKLGGKS